LSDSFVLLPLPLNGSLTSLAVVRAYSAAIRRPAAAARSRAARDRERPPLAPPRRQHAQPELLAAPFPLGSSPDSPSPQSIRAASGADCETRELERAEHAGAVSEPGRDDVRRLEV